MDVMDVVAQKVGLQFEEDALLEESCSADTWTLREGIIGPPGSLSRPDTGTGFVKM